MADIAMLVAEEYERRVKNSKKIRGAANEEEIELFPHFFSLLAKSAGATAADLRGSFPNLTMKIQKGEVKVDLVKRLLEPRSEIGDGASKCFFSA